jgi:hypothetical protein
MQFINALKNAIVNESQRRIIWHNLEDSNKPVWFTDQSSKLIIRQLYNYSKSMTRLLTTSHIHSPILLIYFPPLIHDKYIW